VFRNSQPRYEVAAHNSLISNDLKIVVEQIYFASDPKGKSGAGIAQSV
jgi:hypothetical protein